MTRLFDTVPVVAAMKSIGEVAKQEGFEYRNANHAIRTMRRRLRKQKSLITWRNPALRNIFFLIARPT